MNGKNGSAEHLYELIRVCLLMQRHKDFILAQKRLIANAQGELRIATLQTNAAFAQAKHQIIAIVVEIRVAIYFKIPKQRPFRKLPIKPGPRWLAVPVPSRHNSARILAAIGPAP
jgi:hypothetical protein